MLHYLLLSINNTIYIYKIFKNNKTDLVTEITINYETWKLQLLINQSGNHNIVLTYRQVDLFTMHGPAWLDSVVSFEMRMINVQASRDVEPADLRCFE